MLRVLAFTFLLAALPFSVQAGAFGPLVSVDELADQHDRDNVVILDVRSGIDGSDRSDFEAGHIPGAIYASYTEAGWRQERDGVPGTLPEVEALEELIGSLGVDNDTHVVVVPAGVGSTDFGSAARVYWTFKVLGHDSVSILNGGHAAWVEAGHDVDTGWNEPTETTFSADFRPELIADADGVEEARQAGVQLVDNRPADQFSGREAHPAARAPGTIPGSLNVEQQHLTHEDTAFLVDGDTIGDLMQQAGVEDNGRTITFCNTGHWAALGWFAMSEVAGYTEVAMYDGSMTDWAQDQNRPLQTERRGLGALVEWLFD